MVAVSHHSGSLFRVSIAHVDGLELIPGPTHDISGEVTCIAFTKFAEETALFVGVWEGGRPLLMVFPTQTGSTDQQSGPLELDISQREYAVSQIL